MKSPLRLTARTSVLHAVGRSSILLVGTTLIVMAILLIWGSPKLKKNQAFKSRECIHSALTEFGQCETCGESLGL